VTVAYARTTLEGTVTRGGEPLARAYVQLRDRDGEFTGEWRTRADGAYRFELPPGAWNLVVLTAAGAKAEREVQVPPDGGIRLDIEIDPAP
jgi:uncharacterized protein DUF1416